MDASDEVLEVGLRRGRRVDGAHGAALLVEDDVGGERVEVDVEIQAAPESLREGHRARLGPAHAREALGGARDLFGEDAAHCGQDVGLQCGEAAELEGQGHHPLANGDIGEDAVGDGRRLVAHATCPAARAESALLTRKGHEDVVPARVASAADEALRKVAAEEVSLEGVGDVPRQRRAVGRAGVGEEGLVVLADELMEHGLLRPAGHVRGAEARQGRCAATRRVPARLRGISADASIPGGGAAMAEGGGAPPLGRWSVTSRARRAGGPPRGRPEPSPHVWTPSPLVPALKRQRRC